MDQTIELTGRDDVSFIASYAERVAEDYHDGASVEELAANYGVSGSTIRRALDAEGVAMRKPGARPKDDKVWTEKDELAWQAFLTLDAEGHSITEIARRLALTPAEFHQKYWALTNKRQRLGLD